MPMIQYGSRNCEAQVIWRLDHHNQSVLAQSAGLDLGNEMLMQLKDTERLLH